MPKIIIQSTYSDGTPGRVTLAERAVPTDLHNDHYVLQLIERIAWALNDADQLEAKYDQAAVKPPVGDDNGGGSPTGLRQLLEVRGPENGVVVGETPSGRLEV